MCNKYAWCAVCCYLLFCLAISEVFTGLRVLFWAVVLLVGCMYLLGVISRTVAASRSMQCRWPCQPGSVQSFISLIALVAHRTLFSEFEELLGTARKSHILDSFSSNILETKIAILENGSAKVHRCPLSNVYGFSLLYGWLCGVRWYASARKAAKTERPDFHAACLN